MSEVKELTCICCPIGCSITVEMDGKEVELTGKGNGRLDSVSDALKKHFGISYTLSTYEEHALQRTTKSQACAYVAIDGVDDVTYWGVGIDDDIINASVKAIISAVNRYMVEMESDQ